MNTLRRSNSSRRKHISSVEIASTEEDEEDVEDVEARAVAAGVLESTAFLLELLRSDRVVGVGVETCSSGVLDKIAPVPDFLLELFLALPFKFTIAAAAAISSVASPI